MHSQNEYREGISYHGIVWLPVNRVRLNGLHLVVSHTPLDYRDFSYRLNAMRLKTLDFGEQFFTSDIAYHVCPYRRASLCLAARRSILPPPLACWKQNREDRSSDYSLYHLPGHLPRWFPWYSYPNLNQPRCCKTGCRYCRRPTPRKHRLKSASSRSGNGPLLGVTAPFSRTPPSLNDRL